MGVNLTVEGLASWRAMAIASEAGPNPMQIKSWTSSTPVDVDFVFGLDCLELSAHMPMLNVLRLRRCFLKVWDKDINEHGPLSLLTKY